MSQAFLPVDSIGSCALVAESEQTTPFYPMDSVTIRMHNCQSDNQDLCGSNPQKMVSENLNNLGG